jgi:hypothetical protein
VASSGKRSVSKTSHEKEPTEDLNEAIAIDHGHLEEIDHKRKREIQ